MSCESANYPEQDPMCDCFGCFERRAIEAAAKQQGRSREAMKRFVAICLWKIANKLARVGCWVRGAHIDPSDFPRKGYCQQCGLRHDLWRLPADVKEGAGDG